MRHRGRIAVTGCALALSLSVASTVHASRSGWPLRAHDDRYVTSSGELLAAQRSVLLNDSGWPVTLVAHTPPSHGSLDLAPDGTFKYKADPGFAGTDTFTYTVTDAVRLYSTSVPPLATIGGVPITGGAYGSAIAPVPYSFNEFYGITDRGPNVDGPGDVKIEPLPQFTPSIGRFILVNGKAILERTIPMRAADGSPYSGRVNPQASTGETIVDLDGNVLPPDPNGYDPEGLVALPDGTFWVSDEYGPYITHFGADGRALERLSPFDGTLPRELANRVVNRGMEGLAITPDGTTLVGIMQSALQQPDLTAKAKKVPTLRIVTVDLRTRATHEYLYLLDDPAKNSGAVSEITALSPTRFLVVERDGDFEPGAYKRLFEIDLAGATDVGPGAAVPGATYDASRGGLLIAGTTIEQRIGSVGTAQAGSLLQAAGIKAVAKRPYLDLGGLLSSLDPTGGFFGHDKIEGVATTDGGRTLVISNDSDFGIDGITNQSPPFQLHAKTLPNGKQDDGELLVVDTAKLPAATSTATVTIEVRSRR